MILNGSTNVQNVIQMALELQFFLKHYKKLSSGGGGFALKPYSVIRLSYTSLLAISPNLQFFENFSSFGSSADPLQQNPGYMVTQASASDPPFYDIFFPLKIPLKSSDDVIALRFGLH